MTGIRMRRNQATSVSERGRRDTRPLVSILICNHNYGAFISRAVDSALAQTYQPVEVIVVDDGSTDESRERLREYGRRIRLVLQANAGQPSALNRGFKACRGTLIALLDSDDLFVPTKIASLVEVFERNPLAQWVFHELDYIDASGASLPVESLADRDDVRSILRRRARYPAFASIDLRRSFAVGEKLAYTAPALSALSFRREALEAILPMPEDIARASDEFPKIAALALFPGIHLGEALARQRIHGANAASFQIQLGTAEAMRYLKTAYHLRRRFGHIGPSTDKWFAASFGKLLGTGGPRVALYPAETRRYLDDYFTPLTWLRQAPRIAFNAARAKLHERVARTVSDTQ